MQAVVADLMTTYTRTGTGKQILILPGWADTATHWQSFAHKLAEYYDVIVLDLPGFGGTQPSSKPWGLNEYAGFVADFVAKLKLKPYAVLGHSNGGAIAIRGVASGVLQPEKLVLLASAGIRGEYKGRNKALRLLTKTGKALSAPLPKATQKKLRQKVYKTVGSDMLVAEHMQETFKQVVEDDVRGDTAKLNLPTLLIYGEKDEQTPVRYGRLLHEGIDASTLEILPGADHFLYLGNEAEVVKLTKEFLA